MNDLISRQAAIDALEKVAELFPWRVPGNRDTYDRYNEAWNDAIGRAEIEIEELPSAQPEVIHCCECQHWKQGELVDKCGLLDCYADADCYCAWAVRERRQDEQTD